MSGDRRSGWLAGAQLADELGDAAIFVPGDVRDEDQVQAAVEAATNVGVLRVVVNCAGVATPGRVIGKRGVLPLADFRTVIDINLVGTFNVLRLAAAAMIDNEPLDGDRGLVIMTASVAAYDGQIGQAAYSASKGGIVSLTLTAARDLADKWIRVMTIAPGVMETPMMAGLPGDTKTILELRCRTRRGLADPRNTRCWCSRSSPTRYSTARSFASTAPFASRPGSEFQIASVAQSESWTPTGRRSRGPALRCPHLISGRALPAAGNGSASVRHFFAFARRAAMSR